MRPFHREEFDRAQAMRAERVPWSEIAETVGRPKASLVKLCQMVRQGRYRFAREEREARAAKALELRVEGARNHEVAKALGVSQAWAYSMLARRGYDAETIAEERQMRGQSDVEQRRHGVDARAGASG